MTEVRKHAGLGLFWPDAKSQVTLEYDRERRSIRIETVVVSTRGEFEKAQGRSRSVHRPER